jgi:hypothetical protein
MGNRLGLIAGSGKFPLLVIQEARNQGYDCVVAAVKGSAINALQDRAQLLEWFDVDEIAKVASFFKKTGVQEVVFAGKVDHRIIFKKKNLREHTFPLRNKKPTALLEAAIDYLAKEGITIKSPMPWLSAFLCGEGILTETEPSPEVEEDIAFGWKMARSLADLDVGQTTVVKDKAVVAVEGMEGTDEAIKRGGELAGPGTVVVKVVRSRQDPRVDLPAVGLETIKSMVQAGSRALCFEAGRMPFFQRKEAVSLADTHGISIIAKRSQLGESSYG